MKPRLAQNLSCTQAGQEVPILWLQSPNAAPVMLGLEPRAVSLQKVLYTLSHIPRPTPRICLYYFILCILCFGCIYVCESYTCQVSSEMRRGHQIPGNWNYRWLCTDLVLESKSRSSGRAANLSTFPK